MLGMMNSPTDAVEFYATNQSLKTTLSEEDLKAFTEAKTRQTITYTKDGRRMIDGKLEDAESNTALSMWGNTLMRGAVRTALKIHGVEGEDSVDENNEEHNNERKISEEVPPHVQKIQIAEEPLLTNSPDTKESQFEQMQSNQ